MDDDGERLDFQSFFDRFRQLSLTREPSGKVHLEAVAVATGDQPTAQSVKASLFILRNPARLPQRMRARQRRVTAKRNLDRRREPAQIKSPVRTRNDES